MRILVADEISNRTNHFELAMFSQRDDVDYLDLGLKERTNTRVAPTPWREVVKRIARGTYDAAFIGRPTRLWNPRKALWRNACRFMKSCAHAPTAFRLGPLLSHLRAANVPVGGVDATDTPVIDNSRWPILAASRVFFKRELPTNPANSFLYTTDRTEETGNIMRIPFFRENFTKLRPVSLGIEDARFEQLAAHNPTKHLDVFSAGSIPNRSQPRHRLTGASAAGKKGVSGVGHLAKILRCAVPLPRVRRARVLESGRVRVRLLRTYEAGALGSVPLLKFPPITQHAPFRAEIDGLHYFQESSDLYDVLRARLTRPAELEEMGRRARENVRAHHRDSALAGYLVNTLLGSTETCLPGS